jgi:hypothetical protein
MICTEEDVTIGRMVISPMKRGSGKVWITWVDSAEGMECDEAKLAACLEAFYSENF